MKNLFSVLVVFSFMATVSLTSVEVANAQTANSCGNATISNTGPGSQNTVTCEDETTVVINCSNGTVIRIDVDQDAESGDAENGNNTNSGDATSGDVSNESDLVIDVENSCAETEEEPNTPTTPVVPAVTTPTTPDAPQETPVVVLPNTGDAISLQSVVLVLTLTSILTIVTTSAVRLYSKS